MGESRKPYFDKRVSDEWSALTWKEEPMSLEVKEARAKALFESCRKDGQWIVEQRDASLACSPIVVLSAQGGRFGEVIEYLEAYFEHPDAGSDEITYVEFRARLGAARILVGQIASGVETLQEILDRSDFRDPARRHVIRNNFIHMIDSIGVATAVDPLVRAFLLELFKGWKGQTRKARLIREAQTHGEVLSVLETTYSKKKLKPPKKVAI